MATDDKTPATMLEDIKDPNDLESASTTATAAEEAAIIRKLDWHMMPLLFLIYTFSVLDRSNLGNAKLLDLGDSVDLTGAHYQWLGTAFYIAYISFQWTAVGWKMCPPHIWVTIVTCIWGTIATLQASVTNYAGLCVLRVVLGAGEAMFAGVPLYLSFFYPRDRVGLRQGIFLSGSALANSYGGALGYAIGGIKSHLEGWQMLFLIEGLPTYLIAVLAFFYIPDSIAKAKFLNEREREIAYDFVKRGQIVEHGRLSRKEVLSAFVDYRSYVPGMMYFSCNVSFASLPLFVPTIIAEIGVFSRQQSNGLSAPPYLLVFMAILTTSFISDRLRLRGPFVCGPALMAFTGFVLLATTTGAAPRYLGVFLAIWIFVSIGILLPWVANIHSSESKRTGGFAIFATMGQFGPLVGTNIFPKHQGPYFFKGSWISAAFCLLVAVLAAIFSLMLRWENKRLDRIFEEGRREDEEREKGFRYIY